MLVNAYARAGLALVAALLLVGCRTNTDRIRVLEAEKADAERRNRDLMHAQAELRAEKIKAEGEAESERARNEALEARLEMTDRTPSATEGRDSADTEGIDIERLSEELGKGAEVVGRDGGGATIVLASDVTFPAGRADLNRQAQETLRRVAKTLKQTSGYTKLRIEGHTDSDPIRKSGWKDNRELSLARASKVRMFLVAQGLEEDLMSVEGHGADDPIASNTSSQGKARNRRVEIVLVTPRD
jgi:flagellar motor protein MotB